MTDESQCCLAGKTALEVSIYLSPSLCWRNNFQHQHLRLHGQRQRFFFSQQPPGGQLRAAFHCHAEDCINHDPGDSKTCLRRRSTRNRGCWNRRTGKSGLFCPGQLRICFRVEVSKLKHGRHRAFLEAFPARRSPMSKTYSYLP